TTPIRVRSFPHAAFNGEGDSASDGLGRTSTTHSLLPCLKPKSRATSDTFSLSDLTQRSRSRSPWRGCDSAQNLTFGPARMSSTLSFWACNGNHTLGSRMLMTSEGQRVPSVSAAVRAPRIISISENVGCHFREGPAAISPVLVDVLSIPDSLGHAPLLLGPVRMMIVQVGLPHAADEQGQEVTAPSGTEGDALIHSRRAEAAPPKHQIDRVFAVPAEQPMLLKPAPTANGHQDFARADVRLPQRLLGASLRELLKVLREVLMVLVHDGGHVEPGLEEVGMTFRFFLREHGVVGKRAGPEGKKDLAKQVDEVVLLQPRAEEQERPTPEYVGERSAEVRFGVDDPLVVVVADDHLSRQFLRLVPSESGPVGPPARRGNTGQPTGSGRCSSSATPAPHDNRPGHVQGFGFDFDGRGSGSGHTSHRSSWKQRGTTMCVRVLQSGPVFHRHG